MHVVGENSNFGGISGSGFDGSGATPGWWADVLWVVGIDGVMVWWPDAKMEAACLPFEECGPELRMRMEEPAALRHNSPSFSHSFSLSFFYILSLVFW